MNWRGRWWILRHPFKSAAILRFLARHPEPCRKEATDAE